MNLKKLASLALLGSAIFMTGCTAIPTMQTDDPDYKKMTEFSAEKDSGVLYIFRAMTSDYNHVVLDLDINDEDYLTHPRCYTRFELPPGTYHLEADHPDTFGFEQELDVTFTAGDVKFYEFLPIIKFGIPGESKLIETHRSDAIAKIQSQKLCVSELYVLNKK